MLERGDWNSRFSMPVSETNSRSWWGRRSVGMVGMVGMVGVVGGGGGLSGVEMRKRESSNDKV